MPSPVYRHKAYCQSLAMGCKEPLLSSFRTTLFMKINLSLHDTESPPPPSPRHPLPLPVPTPDFLLQITMLGRQHEKKACYVQSNAVIIRKRVYFEVRMKGPDSYGVAELPPVKMPDPILKRFGYDRLWPLRPACSQTRAGSYMPDPNSRIRFRSVFPKMDHTV